MNATRNEIYVQTFTQSQCYGEYHCFHAKLTEDNFVEIHVGAPTPNIEHSCLKPSFDIDVPYLLATLVPDIDIDRNSQSPITNFQSLDYLNSIIEDNTEQDIDSQMDLTEKSQNLDKIQQHAMKLVRQYQSDFSDKIQNWVIEFTNQVKLLFLS